MKVLTGIKTGREIQITRLISSGGEGEIWHTNLQKSVAKIYYDVTSERLDKLAVMVDKPPEDPMLRRGHVAIAWPQELLKDQNTGKIVGFLMPEILNGKSLITVYNPLRRRKVAPALTWLHLHVIAQNVAIVVESIHKSQYVIGDIKQENFLVPQDSLFVSLVDTDSMQIQNPQTGEIYHCPVGTSDYTPPELYGKDFKTIKRTEIHDRFGLAIIIYQLLFGEHPFTGVCDVDGVDQSLEERISHGSWPYAPKSPISSRPSAITLKTVNPIIQGYFQRCFTKGHQNPERRPSASEWVNALNLAREDLIKCQALSSHYYDKNYGRCCWCEFQENFRYDYFPPLPEERTEVSEQPPVRPPKAPGPSPKASVSESSSPALSPLLAGLAALAVGSVILFGVEPVRENFTIPLWEQITETHNR